MRRIVRVIGFAADVAILAFVVGVVFATYNASVEPQLQPPSVDWSESYEIWRDNTGDLPPDQWPQYDSEIPEPPPVLI